MRLIDADALEKSICQDKCGLEECCMTFERDGAEYCLEVQRVKDAPTIEAEPVRHGRWELIGGYRYIGGYGCQYRCSNCIKCADHRTNYCPNCGAKMDEVNDETN